MKLRKKTSNLIQKLLIFLSSMIKRLFSKQNCGQSFAEIDQTFAEFAI